MDNKDSFFGNNAYLNIAYMAINFAKRPLMPYEMLDIAKTEGFLPKHLHGKTPHKTMSARLAVYIREKSGKSDFYRTKAATFFLHSLTDLPETLEEYKTVFIGNLRSKSIRKENVLVAPKNIIKKLAYGEFTKYEENAFQEINKNGCFFMDRAESEMNDEVKQFVTFTLVYNENNLLVYTRGKFTTTSERLKGQMSVGFGGHINDKDFNLFALDGGALLHNAARELREELFFDDLYKNDMEVEKRTNLLGYVNVDDSPDAQHHIAVLVAFNHKSSEIPKKGELSINQLSWLDLNVKLNDLTAFDLWSGLILKNLFQGTIKLNGATE
ncbi:MAG: hypothetical protein JKY84_05840 [Emcibacteraceae bacterium]|nr:hypothetical protein [Emcibacteraceae bacterium]